MVNWLEKRPGFFAFLGALGVGASGIISINTSVPTLLHPYSYVVTVVALLCTDWVSRHTTSYAIVFFLAVLPVVVFFAAWSFRLFSGQRSIPLRSFILFIILTGLCVIYLGSGLRYGLEYQGFTYTAVMIGYNLVAIIGLILLWRANRKAPRFWSNLAFHVVLFSWLAWCAFPWLGEEI